MQNNFLAALSLLVLLANGCSDKTSEQSALATEAVATATETPAEPAALVTAPVPDAKSVLADVYKQTVAKVSDSQLSDGRYVGYWNGQQYTLDGKNYFVAFTEATPPSEIEYPAPEDKVTISQATYEFTDGQWQLKSVQADVGQFGGNNKAPVANTAAKTAVFENARGKLFLAAAYVVLANEGIQLSSREIFALSPESGKWKYLGSIDTGSDNSAGCSREADSAIKTKCASNTSTLEFSTIENSNWPVLKVIREGTELDDKGNLIALSGKDSVTYRYEEKNSGYAKVSQ